VLTAKGRRALATIRKLRAQVWREVLRPTSTAQRVDLIAWARAIIEKAQAPPKKAEEIGTAIRTMCLAYDVFYISTHFPRSQG
jgi:hypothetical protein